MTPAMKPNPPAIVRVSANKSTFREVIFAPGFNIILAERTKESTKKDSRNGLGKSTLIEIIAFCLGAQAKKNKGLLVEELQGWEFTVDLTLGGKAVKVTRGTENSGKVEVDGDTSAWPVQPTKEKGLGRLILKVNDWNTVLGYVMLGLPPSGFNTDYAPTFRSVISYFMRRGRDSYSTPFECYRKQREWDKQIQNAFLLGLAWEDASEWQKLKDRKKLLGDLRKAAKADLMIDFLQGSLGELEASKVRLLNMVREEEASLISFKVHPQYKEIESEANRLSAAIRAEANRIIVDRQLLQNFEASLLDVPAPNIEDVVTVYEEAGVLFPNQAKKRLEDVKDFHRQLIENRKRFLSSEITRLRQSLEMAESEQRKLIDQRAEMLLVLKSHGALDEFTRLQQILAEHRGQLAAVQGRIENMRRLEEGTSNIKIDEELLKKKARNDLDDRKVNLGMAIAKFNENSLALYETPGNLVIDVGDSGFRFEVEIKRSGSGGVSNMKVFCYDLMLAELWATRTNSPKLLIHDSYMFDGVDERQIANALELAARKSNKDGFQYICCLNSDTLPTRDFSPNFDIRSYMRLELTDKEVSGSLLGIRY